MLTVYEDRFDLPDEVECRDLHRRSYVKWGILISSGCLVLGRCQYILVQSLTSTNIAVCTHTVVTGVSPNTLATILANNSTSEMYTTVNDS